MTTAEILAEAGVRREDLGREVRRAWIAWALTQAHPKRSWLVPYDALTLADQEADNQIGEKLFRLGWEAGRRGLSGRL